MKRDEGNPDFLIIIVLIVCAIILLPYLGIHHLLRDQEADTTPDEWERATLAPLDEEEDEPW